MPSLKLTALTVASLPAGNHFDALCPGLILRVGKRRRTFAYRWRSGGRNPCLTLGHFPAMSLAQAREAAREAGARIDSGAAPLAATPHPRSAASLSLGALVDKYEAMRLREGKRTKALHKRLRAVRNELAPYAGLPAGAFRKSDVRAIRDAVVGRTTGVHWNRIRATLRVVLNWAVEEDFIEANPVLGVRRVAEHSRERVLSAAELRTIWRACETKLGTGLGVAEPFSRLVRLLILTGLRRGEAAGIRYRDILDGRLSIPETKTGKPHVLKLPPLALRLIGHGDPDALAFAGPAGKPIGGWSKSIERLRKACPEIAEAWHLHDLRRSCATHMQDLGIRPDVVEAVLGHALPGISSVGSVYMRAELEEAKADALRRWADEIQRIVDMPVVVPLRRQVS